LKFCGKFGVSGGGGVEGTRLWLELVVMGVELTLLDEQLADQIWSLWQPITPLSHVSPNQILLQNIQVSPQIGRW